MANHGVALPEKYMAKDVDSLVRTFVSADEIDNGFVFYQNGKSATAGEGEVWATAKPATAHLYDLWMAVSPEVVLTTSKYKGIDPNIQNFTNAAGEMITAFKPQVGDIIVLTAEALGTGTGAASAFAVATDATYQLTWAAAAVSGLSLKYVETTYISSPTAATIGASQRIVAYRFEVVAVK